MKKTFVACLAVVALFALATSASAITCTIDQRPAATLLIPYFQATFNLDGTPLNTGPTALDTLVTIGNASSAPMLAHVTVWNDRSEIALDFNIALTGFDIQSWAMSSLLRGFLPETPVNQSHVPQVKDANQVLTTGNVCQSNPASIVYPNPGGYLRVKPTFAASTIDNTNATTVYPAGPFPSSFLFQVLDVLDTTKDTTVCLGGVDNVIANPIHGYVTIDMINYCTLTNPDDPLYWTQDAGGYENNLWGDYIYTSGAGLGTLGFPAVAIEATSLADFCFDCAFDEGSLSDNTAAPADPASATGPGKRTFYRRYLLVADAVPCVNAMPAPQNAWDCGFGDQREPLGLKYAARWFDSSPAVTSFFNVWRGSSGSSTLFAGGLDRLTRPFVSGVAKCTAEEPTVILNFFDEDENTVTTNCPQSPCAPAPDVNFPLETQRTSIIGFTHPAWPAGWVSMEFYNNTAPIVGTLDQAYVTYDFQGASQFLSAGIQAAQLDPTNCQPLLVPCLFGVPPECYGPNSVPGVQPTSPIIPLIVGTGP
jgi:hypothetical protein